MSPYQQDIYGILELVRMSYPAEKGRAPSRYQIQRRKMITRQFTGFVDLYFNFLDCFLTDPFDFSYEQITDIA